MKKVNFLRFWLLLALGTATAVFSACRKDGSDDGWRKDLPPTKDGKVVLVMKPETVAQSLISISGNDVLTFKGLPNDETPIVGDIICSGITENAPYGFFYKVKKVTASGGNTVIETEMASLEEAVKNAVIDQTFNLIDYIEGVFDEEGNPVEYEILPATRANVGAYDDNPVEYENLPVTRANVDFPTIRLQINEKVKLSQGLLSANATITGSITLSSRLEHKGIIDNHKQGDMRLVYHAESNLKLSYSGELHGKADLFKVLGYNGLVLVTIPLAPINFVIPAAPIPIPVTIRQSLSLVLKGEVGGKLQMNAEFENTSSVSAGVKYENGILSEVLDQKSTSTANAKPSISGEFKVTLEPRYRWSMYGLEKLNSLDVFAGFYTKFELSQDILELAENGRYGLTPHYTHSWGIDAGVRGILNLIALRFPTLERSINLYKDVLFEGCPFPQFTEIAIEQSSPTSMFVSTDVTVEDYEILFPVTEYGFCISEDKYPTKNDKYINLGASDKRNFQLNAEFQDLKEDTDYYVCAYFVNDFGTFYSKVEHNGIEDSEYVEINGVKWSTRNIGGPGQFVKNPEDYGQYYQWNRSSSEFIPTDDYGDSDYPKASSWQNDPSPSGYRLPTFAEIESLCNTSYVSIVWTKRNEVNGKMFTDKVTGNSIFIPAGGYQLRDITPRDVGERGYYWSSPGFYFDYRNSKTTHGYSLVFNNGAGSLNGGILCSCGLNIRPVLAK